MNAARRAGRRLARGALLIAAYLISLAAFLAALVLLYRLVALELGRERAEPAVLLLAVFPASLFFGAPYSESLFLLASVGAFYAARTGHWAWAGAAAGAAAATRSAGILLLLPLALFWWRQARSERDPVDLAWLALAPLALAAYAIHLGAFAGGRLRLPRGAGGLARVTSPGRSAVPGTASTRPSTARASCCRARARRCTSTRPAATRTGSPP